MAAVTDDERAERARCAGVLWNGGMLSALAVAHGGCWGACDASWRARRTADYGWHGVHGRECARMRGEQKAVVNEKRVM
jgi:hypothetical protein